MVGAVAGSGNQSTAVCGSGTTELPSGYQQSISGGRLRLRDSRATGKWRLKKNTQWLISILRVLICVPLSGVTRLASPIIIVTRRLSSEIGSLWLVLTIPPATELPFLVTHAHNILSSHCFAQPSFVFMSGVFC